MSVLVYHVVCVAKYRRVVLDESVDKSVTAREVLARCPHVKKKLWGGEFWSDGYFIASVGQQESEETVRRYVKEQGQNRIYRQLHTQAADFPLATSSQSYTP